MGSLDIKRQAPNVLKWNYLNAEIVPVNSGTSTLKDTMNEALRDWVSNIRTLSMWSEQLRDHPYPMMVRDFQSVIGIEARKQILEYEKVANYLIACIGGGSNALGLFYPFLNDQKVKIIELRLAAKDLKQNIQPLVWRKPGSSWKLPYLLQNSDGQIIDAHSISAGLDYPGIGPEHSWLKDIGRVKYESATDNEAWSLQICSKLEYNSALEPSHALAYT